MVYQNKEVNPVATLGDFIWIKDGSLSKKQCKNIVKKFEESEESHYVGKIGKDEINQQVKQTIDFQVTNAKGWEDIDSILFKALKQGLDEYVSYCTSFHPCLQISNIFTFHDTGYQIQRYEPEGFYEWHQDWTMDDDASRVYTYIWYLNTIKKKDGGYTQFIDGTKMQPKAGRLVMFPALWPYLHRAFPPKVRKYICTGWIYAKL